MDRAREIIADELDVALDKVTPEKRIVEDLGADSLDAVNLTMALEEQFDIEIPDDDAEKLLTVKDVYDYLEVRLSTEHAR